MKIQPETMLIFVIICLKGLRGDSKLRFVIFGKFWRSESEAFDTEGLHTKRFCINGNSTFKQICILKPFWNDLAVKFD